MPRLARAVLFDEFAVACGVGGQGDSPVLPESVVLDLDVGAFVIARTAITEPASLPISVTASGGSDFGDCPLGGSGEARIVLGFSLGFLGPAPAPPVAVAMPLTPSRSPSPRTRRACA
jgi:hypothetical protein